MLAAGDGNEVREAIPRPCRCYRAFAGGLRLAIEVPAILRDLGAGRRASPDNPQTALLQMKLVAWQDLTCALQL